MANTTSSTVRPGLWTMWAPSLGVMSLLGAHLTAAMLGLYSSAPTVKILQPVTGISQRGQVDIAAQADDGPMGSGVSKVEFQVDSTAGAWKPLALDPLSASTYRGQWDATKATQGEHELYLRATDYTGNLRTVQLTITVSPDESPLPGGTSESARARTADLSARILGAWAESDASRR